LDQGAEAEELVPVAVATHNRVRVADGARRDLELLAVDVQHFRPSDLDLADVDLDLAPVDSRAQHPLAEPEPDVRDPGSLGEPPRGDPRAVARELRGRPVRVPDQNGRLRSVDRDDLEHAVRTDAAVVVAQRSDTVARQ